MSLQDYLRILLRRGWIVLLAALLVGGSAYLWSRTQAPEYRASAVILVRVDSLDFGRIQASKQVLSSFSKQIRSEKMAFEVVDRLQLDQNPYDVLGRLAISTNADQFTLQIDATDRDPETAGRIANGFAEAFVAEIDRANQDQIREDQIQVEVIQQAGPGAQTGPKTMLNTLAGLLLGTLLGTMLILAMELLDSSLKSREEIERVLGRDIMLLAQIPPE